MIGTLLAVSSQKKLGVVATADAAAFKLEGNDGMAMLTTSEE